MTPSCSRAAIRLFVVAFLAQSLVNAAAVLPPHEVLNTRDAVANVPVSVVLETRQDATNVFDALINTLKGYNGWEVFRSFFDKLFNPPAPEDENEPVPEIPTPSKSIDIVSVVASIFSEVIETIEPTPEPNPSTPINIVSVVASIFSEVIETIEPTLEPTFEPIPEPTPEPTPTESIFTILPVGNISTAVVLFPTEEPTATIAPPVLSINATVPTNPLILTNPLRPTEVPILNITGELNTTVSLTSTLEVTLTIAPLSTGAPSAGTDLPIAISDAGSVLFPNVTTVTPTFVLGTGTGAATIVPTIVVTPLFPNTTTDEAPAPAIGTGTAVLGTAVSSMILPSSLSNPLWTNGTESANATSVPVVVVGTAVLPEASASATPSAIVDVSPIFPNVTLESTPITTTLVLATGTGVVSAGTIIATAIADTALPFFPNGTATELPVLGTSGIVLATAPLGTAPVTIDLGTIIASTTATASVETALALFPNATTTTTTVVITPTAALETLIDLAPEVSLITESTAPLVIELPTPTLSVVIPDASIVVPEPAIETIAPPVNDGPAVEFPGITPPPITLTPPQPQILPQLEPAPVPVPAPAPQVAPVPQVVPLPAPAVTQQIQPAPQVVPPAFPQQAQAQGFAL